MTNKNDFNSSARPQIIKYADADQALKAKMEAVMATIDADPASFDAVLSYGEPTQKKLGDLVSEILKTQKKAAVHFDAYLAIPGGSQNTGSNISSIAAGLQDSVKEYRKLLATHLALSEELAVYLGAAPEILRRYDQVYAGKHDQTALTQRKEDFQDKYALLQEVNTALHIAGEQLIRALDTTKGTLAEVKMSNRSGPRQK